MLKIAALVSGLFLLVSGFFVKHQASNFSTQISNTAQNIISQENVKSKALSDEELLKLATNKYADGNLPLGDYRYVTDAPKKGYIYLCNVKKENFGAQTNGPWIKGQTWNYLNKTFVHGSVSWPNAQFSNTISGENRILKGNNLPLTHTTGVYPIQSSDPAYSYDRNPNTIKTQNLLDTLPANPTYSETPYCMGGEVGVMLSGVPLFNGFDAPLRDAPAHELQDSCGGHPQESGEYHYHNLSSCFKDISVKTVLGFALDGFPITGPKVAEDKYLTTDSLDECHGIISEVNLDGKQVTTYHYVMTQDFPYSASCFRGKAIQPQRPDSGQERGRQGGMQPPEEAISSCSGRSQGSSCSFSTPDGKTISGSCQTPPGQSGLICVPAR